jgi:tetratricopeptide (TPR) repeat protein
MKKLCFLLISTFLFAVSFDNAIAIRKSEFDYLKELPAVKKILKNDIYYKMAMDYLTNARKKIVLYTKDNEIGKRKKILLINYEAALEMFKKSIDVYKNPISAIKGYRLILLNQDRIKDKNKLKYKKDFAKLMYQYGLCYGYLTYGKIFEDGFYTKVDKKKALKIYEQGIKICRKLHNWEFSELMERIIRLKRKLKLKK